MRLFEWKLSDLFGAPVETPIVTAPSKPASFTGWHAALNWIGTETAFFGLYCEKCQQHYKTPLLKDVGLSYKVTIRHCGHEESMTISELVAADLPTIRTEPHHHGGQNSDQQFVQVGSFDTDGGEISYEPADYASPGKDWGGGGF